MKDLNLLRILVAIHECDSVTAAAARLNMSQPTVSQALSRLRDITGDPLFLRGPHGMTPTAHATHLYRECAASLHRLENALRSDEPFVPATADDRFTLALSDLGEMTFLPPLVRRLSQLAPSIRLDVVPLQAGQVENQLKLRRIDFAVGNLGSNDPEVTQLDLFDENYVALLNKANSGIADQLTLDQFLANGHAVVSGAAEHWQVSDLSTNDNAAAVDVQITLPHFTALPFVICESDLIAVLPSRTAQSFSQIWPLRWLPLPFKLPNFTVRLMALDGPSARRPGREWMIEQIRDVMASLQPIAHRY